VQSINNPLLDDFLVWLNQTIPLYWLIVALLLGLLWGVGFVVRQRRRVQMLNDERESLSLTRASNEQQIETLHHTNTQLTAKVDANAVQIERLVAETAELKSSRDEKQQQLIVNENERLGLREMHENNQRKIARLEADVRVQQAHLETEKDKLVELQALIERQKVELKNEFKVVSEEIIKERQAMLSEQNKEGVGALLKPLQEQIAGFQKRVNEVHDESIKGNTHLRSEIESVMKMGLQMREEASNLTTALKGDSQQRGAWGEAQLERTLELSGLIENDHYEKQSSFVDEEGKTKRTDYIIKLPGDKCIVIDSKVALNAYERAVNTVDEDVSTAMSQHVAVVRSHINELAKKDYTNLSGIHSPDYILMFMPVEPAYIEALKHDRDLFAYGYSRNVILVSHTTLIPILRTVANLWTLDRSNKEARQIGEKANDIYNSVATVSERLEALGKALNSVGTHYNKTVTAISGKQGLQGKVQRFTELSSKATKSMPELEHKHIDLDTAKLAAQPLIGNDAEADEEQSGS
jgi:DNA recombination protein RmuC